MLKNSENLDPNVKRELFKRLLQNPHLLPPGEREKVLKEMLSNIKNLDRYGLYTDI